MIIIDERSQIREVAERWKAQYCNGRSWGIVSGGDPKAIYEQLEALDPETAVARDVAKIIGNSSWAGPQGCHECGETVARLVQLGQTPDYESHYCEICEGCLRKALTLITANPTTSTPEKP